MRLDKAMAVVALACIESTREGLESSGSDNEVVNGHIRTLENVRVLLEDIYDVTADVQ